MNRSTVDAVAEPGSDVAPNYQSVVLAVEATGLRSRGGFNPLAEHGVPDMPDGRPTATVLLLGLAGSADWRHYSASAEASDGAPDPLDRWSRRMIDALAATFGGRAVYPFPTDRPPFLPFQRWARAADMVYPSPIQILIHPDWGLWHSYRGALLFPQRLELPAIERRPSPCTRCLDHACLTACPTDAFEGGAFSTSRCLRHLQSPDGADCLDYGCRARRACPVGTAHRHTPAEAALHMRAFLAQQSNRHPT